MEEHMQTINKISDCLTDVGRIGIGGHIRPDGDCVGSTLALYTYLKKNFPQKIYLTTAYPSYLFQLIYS
jgi:nanoRNase/pAp phosphatase (c-di-AMP/oligoRNAs hydrolase)